MNVTCPKCDTTYRVDPAKVPSGGVRARCTECGEVIDVRSAPSDPEAGAGLAEPTMDGAAGVVEERGSARVDADEEVEGPGAPPTEVGDGAREGAAATVDGSPPDTGESVNAGGEGPEPAAVVAETDEPTSSAPEDSASSDPGIGHGEEQATPAPRAPRPAPAFGATDPDAKARRLSRALISDIVVYHPERRERSIEAGSLRQEFREEIQKSWEEYVAQVGDATARGTTHFRDALNEILAGGRPVF